MIGYSLITWSSFVLTFCMWSCSLCGHVGKGYWWGALLEESPKLVILLRLTGHSKDFRSLLLMNLPAFISRGEIIDLFLRNFRMLTKPFPTSSSLSHAR